MDEGFEAWAERIVPEAERKRVTGVALEVVRVGGRGARASAP